MKIEKRVRCWRCRRGATYKLTLQAVWRGPDWPSDGPRAIGQGGTQNRSSSWGLLPNPMPAELLAFVQLLHSIPHFAVASVLRSGLAR